MVYGGYLELELSSHGHFHADAIYINSGRNCLERILKIKGYDKVQVPAYTCDAVTNTLQKLNIVTSQYSIDKNLEVSKPSQLDRDQPIIFNNYFGLKGKYLMKVISQFPFAIIDNSQAFFDENYYSMPVFYSPRKFFGVPDGGIVKIPGTLPELIDGGLNYDISYLRMNHLLKSKDLGIEAAYKNYLENEAIIGQLVPMKMSNLTEKLLQSINYQFVKKQRTANFLALQDRLKDHNLFLGLQNEISLFSFPFMLKKAGLRDYLIEHKVFTPMLWPNVLIDCPKNSVEWGLAANLVHLPIDQRMGYEDMKILSELVLKFINNG